MKEVIDEYRNTSQTEHIESLITALKNTPLSDGHQYENVLNKVLFEVFKTYYPDHFDLKEQSSNRGGIKRRDFFIYNSGPTHRFLKDLKDQGAKWLLFEAKNSTKPLSPDKLNNLIMYLLKNPYFGKTAFLISEMA